MSLKTLDQALGIMKMFSKGRPTRGVRELANELGMNEANVHRVLSTFEKQGFMIQNPITKKYELGYKLWEYGLLVQNRTSLLDHIKRLMGELSEETGETIFLTWLDETECVCAHISETQQKIKFDVRVGRRKPLYAGASNKVIMAHLPRETQMKIVEHGINAFTEKTILDPAKLIDNLQQIRDQGWCLSVGEFTEDVLGLATPLFDRKGSIIGSLALSAPVYRLPESKSLDVLPLLKKHCQRIQTFMDHLVFNDTEFKKLLQIS